MPRLKLTSLPVEGSSSPSPRSHPWNERCQRKGGWTTTDLAALMIAAIFAYASYAGWRKRVLFLLFAIVLALLANGVEDDQILVIPNEEAAIDTALREAKPGDLLLTERDAGEHRVGARDRRRYGGEQTHGRGDQRLPERETDLDQLVFLAARDDDRIDTRCAPRRPVAGDRGDCRESPDASSATVERALPRSTQSRHARSSAGHQLDLEHGLMDQQVEPGHQRHLARLGIAVQVRGDRIAPAARCTPTTARVGRPRRRPERRHPAWAT